MKSFKSFIIEHDGPIVWSDGKNHIEKISDTEFKVYHGDKETKSFSSLEDAKASLMKECIDLEEATAEKVMKQHYKWVKSMEGHTSESIGKKLQSAKEKHDAHAKEVQEKLKSGAMKQGGYEHKEMVKKWNRLQRNVSDLQSKHDWLKGKENKAKKMTEEVELDEGNAKEQIKHHVVIKGHKKSYSVWVDANNEDVAIIRAKQHVAREYNDTAKHAAVVDRLKKEEVELDESEAWQRKEGQSESGGLNRKGIESYRRANPGSKLSMAVTTKPSKLKPGSKAANRRKSFCARMGGMKKRLTSAKTAKDPDSRINKALRKWNC